MRQKTPRVNIVVNGVILELPENVLTLLPDAPAFVHAIASKPGISMGTALEYARRVAYAKREGRHRKPHLSPYNVESTALKAYWRWIANGYEERIRPVIGTMREYQHLLSLQDSARLRIGCLVPPYPGKNVIQVEPSKFPNHITWVPADTDWTLHVPERADDLHDYRQPLIGPTPTNYTLRVWKLNQHELEAVAKCFYAAWGKEQRLEEMASSLPLFGEPPLLEDLGEPVVRADEKIAALVSTGSFMEHLVTRARGSATGDPTTFAFRVKSESSQYVVVDLKILRENSETVETVLDAVRTAVTTTLPTGRIDEETPLLS